MPFRFSFIIFILFHTTAIGQTAEIKDYLISILKIDTITEYVEYARSSAKAEARINKQFIYDKDARIKEERFAFRKNGSPNYTYKLFSYDKNQLNYSVQIMNSFMSVLDGAYLPPISEHIYRGKNGLDRIEKIWESGSFETTKYSYSLFNSTDKIYRIHYLPTKLETFRNGLLVKTTIIKYSMRE